MNINELLKSMVEKGASDLHLMVGSKPVMRINGDLIIQDDFPVLWCGGDAEPTTRKESRHALRVDEILRAAEVDDADGPCVHRGIFLARIFRGFTPSDGPMTPSASMRSMMRAARL